MLFTYYRQSLAKIFSKKTIDFLESDLLILDLSKESLMQRKKYLQNSKNIQNATLYCKNFDVPPISNIYKLILFMLVSKFYLLIAIIAIFSNKRAQLALVPLEVLELNLLSRFVKKSKIKEIYFFSAYEKDTVFISNYFKNFLKIKIILIPSPNPIRNFYETVVANTFAFTMPFQAAEYEKLKHRWSVDELTHLPIPNFDKIKETSGRVTFPNTIGFLSSGIWLRKLKNRNDQGKGYFEAEQSLIEFLNFYISNREGINLIVYLHPIEKANKVVLETSKKFFKEQFGNKVLFANVEIPSWEQPEKADVAVSPYSSSMFERMYAGYKVLFSQKGMEYNYFGDDKLLKITANNKQEFFSKMDEILNFNTDKYYGLYELEEYRYVKC